MGYRSGSYSRTPVLLATDADQIAIARGLKPLASDRGYIMPVLPEYLHALSTAVLVQLDSHPYSRSRSNFDKTLSRHLGEGDASGYHVHDERDPDAVTADARLPETDVGIHGYSIDQTTLIVFHGISIAHPLGMRQLPIR